VALLADQSADASSNIVVGNGTSSARFTMPGNVAIKVESVVATVNNASASDVTPEVTIRDQSGVVIGTNKQGESIPAGDTGTATFALRLGGGSATTTGFIRYKFVNVGDWLVVETTAAGPFGPGIYLQSSSGMQTFVLSGDYFVNTSNGLIDLDTGGGNFIAATAGGTMTLSTGGGNMTLDSGFSGETMSLVTSDLSVQNGKLGFFGVTTVVQQATPVTLADVIALLQAYGLCP